MANIIVIFTVGALINLSDVNLIEKALNNKKEKLYKVINKNIREIRKGFNVGMSTSNDGDVTNIWKHQYRHWNFISKYSHFDKTLTKKANQKVNNK